MHNLELDDVRFKTYFRLNKVEFEEVLSIIDEDITKKTQTIGKRLVFENAFLCCPKAPYLTRQLFHCKNHLSTTYKMQNNNRSKVRWSTTTCWYGTTVHAHPLWTFKLIAHWDPVIQADPGMSVDTNMNGTIKIYVNNFVPFPSVNAHGWRCEMALSYWTNKILFCCFRYSKLKPLGTFYIFQEFVFCDWKTDLA